MTDYKPIAEGLSREIRDYRDLPLNFPMPGEVTV